MRVVIAEDSVLLREGLVRLLEAAATRSSPRPATSTTCCARRAPTAPTSPSSTSACRPTHTDEGIRAAHAIRAEMPDTGVLVLSQYLDDAYAVALLDPAPTASATCSRTA
jgi:DNA-binding NarL/FixJ family response regulator